MKGILISLLIFFEFAHKCDFYFVGNVHQRRRGHGYDEDQKAVIQGCKKGCFWNETYTDDGVPKCEKCKEIKDENECLSHTATCRWTKSGKCKSQTCPGIAKGRVTLIGQGDDIDDNSTKESQYREQIRLETECIEGSALEKKYNNLYWNDYNTARNYLYTQYDLADTCLNPGSKQDGTNPLNPYGWKAGGNAAANRDSCEKYVSYVYVPDPNTPSDPNADTCERCHFKTITGTGHAAYRAACISTCQFEEGGNDDGSADRCLARTDDDCNSGPGWLAGRNTSAECERVGACVYIKAAGVTYSTTGGPTIYTQTNGLSEADRCVPGCSAFIAGTNNRADCEKLGCTYGGGDLEPAVSPITVRRVGENLKSHLDSDLCPASNRPPARTLGRVCGINATLALDNDPEACNDRKFNEDVDYPCNITNILTEEACKNAHGLWTPPPKSCRELYSTTRSVCEFDERDLKDQIVYVNQSHHGGNRRPGTKYEKCVQDLYDEEDNLRTETIKLYDGSEQTVRARLTPEDREKIYGFRTPEEYCKYQESLVLEGCRRAYNLSVTGCHSGVETNQVTPDSDWKRTPIQIRASRSTCHRIYGCMYSKSNERCSVWAVWAFIFFVVLMTIVVVAVLGVGGVVLLTKLKNSSA